MNSENWETLKVWVEDYLYFLEELRKNVHRQDRKPIEVRIDMMEVVKSKMKELEDMDDTE